MLIGFTSGTLTQAWNIAAKSNKCFLASKSSAFYLEVAVIQCVLIKILYADLESPPNILIVLLAELCQQVLR